MSAGAKYNQHQISALDYGPRYQPDRATTKAVLMVLYALAGPDADDAEIIDIGRMLCAPPHGLVLTHRHVPNDPELAANWRARQASA